MMSSHNNFIFCNDRFFADGLAEVIPFGLAQGTFTFFDNHYLMEYGVKDSLHTIITQPIIFIDNDLDYYALKLLTQGMLMNLVLISKKCNLSEILNSILMATKSCAYKVKFPLSNSELLVLESLMMSSSINDAVEKLKLKEKTVYAHRNAIIKKLNLKNRNALHRLNVWADLFN